MVGMNVLTSEVERTSTWLVRFSFVEVLVLVRSASVYYRPSPLMSDGARVAPARASLVAVARPIPLPAPVTTTTCPSKVVLAESRKMTPHSRDATPCGLSVKHTHRPRHMFRCDLV
jgi:hypothetical protein